jgi:hypothetical protein
MAMPLQQRRKKEEAIVMNIHKTTPSDQPSLHVVDFDWFQQWTDYTNSKVRGAPDKINNSLLEKKLVIDNNIERLCKNRDYITLPKKAWEFLIGIYGGGPTIV